MCKVLLLYIYKAGPGNFGTPCINTTQYQLNGFSGSCVVEEERNNTLCYSSKETKHTVPAQ